MKSYDKIKSYGQFQKISKLIDLLRDGKDLNNLIAKLSETMEMLSDKGLVELLVSIREKEIELDGSLKSLKLKTDKMSEAWRLGGGVEDLAEFITEKAREAREKLKQLQVARNDIETYKVGFMRSMEGRDYSKTENSGDNDKDSLLEEWIKQGRENDNRKKQEIDKICTDFNEGLDKIIKKIKDEFRLKEWGESNKVDIKKLVVQEFLSYICDRFEIGLCYTTEPDPDQNIKTPDFELLTEGYYPPEQPKPDPNQIRKPPDFENLNERHYPCSGNLSYNHSGPENELSDCIKLFAERMQWKLESNKHKASPGEDLKGWDRCSISILFDGAEQELKEAREAYKEAFTTEENGNLLEGLRNELADTANFLMMIHDKLGDYRNE
jgi:hypothetical protein